MRRLFAIFFVVAALVSTGAAQGKHSEKSAKPAGKETTVTGEVVDVSCYLAHGAKGADHQGCAEACIKAGGPVGILSSTGKLYLSVMPDDHSAGPSAKLMDYVGKQVKATGMLRTKAGVNGIMITSVEPAEEKSEK